MQGGRYRRTCTSTTSHDNGWFRNSDEAAEASTKTTSRDFHRQQVLIRAQQMLEKKQYEIQKKHEEKERMASETITAVRQTKLEEVRLRNRIKESKAQQAKNLQAIQHQIREEKLQDELRRLDEASHRHQKKLLFNRFHTAHLHVSSSQRAKVNRTLRESEIEAKRRLQEEREQARAKAAEEERIAREIDMQQRRLLYDERALRCLEHQQEQERRMREKALERQRAYDERLRRLELQKDNVKGGRIQQRMRGGQFYSNARRRQQSVAQSDDRIGEEVSCRFFRAMTTPGYI
ncbi:uncharacterized protein TM35_000071420 [Trypanosoma theileri]|uniref:Uncharacterized protein n=1 Tax=Trypanosoma theileri TaxID=67003 RepID=A0A1X0P1K2_9TRYP|nr:uncharacterized protein TM35_000071420 [Trypanosoma theileri]ORC90718.1 hypothetical protein TM35_000071420 [Trypanosoma theileri]